MIDEIRAKIAAGLFELSPTMLFTAPLNVSVSAVVWCGHARELSAGVRRASSEGSGLTLLKFGTAIEMLTNSSLTLYCLAMSGYVAPSSGCEPLPRSQRTNEVRSDDLTPIIAASRAERDSRRDSRGQPPEHNRRRESSPATSTRVACHEWPFPGVA